MKYKPLNLSPQEVAMIKSIFEDVLKKETYHINNSNVGKIGGIQIEHLLERVKRLEPKGESNDNRGY